VMDREHAVGLHQAGRIGEAADIYETLLRAKPDDADLWGLLSVAQFQLDRNKEALASWRKCLSIETVIPLRLRNMANFLVLARQKGKTEAQISDFLRGLEVPNWPKGLAPEPETRSMITGLARCLVDFGQKEAALRLLESLLADLSSDPDFLVSITPIMIAAGNPEKVLEPLRLLTSGAHRDNGAILIAHTAAARAAQQRQEAELMRRRACEAVPVLLSRKMPNQRMLIGILDTPYFAKDAPSVKNFHFSANTPAALATKMNDDFRFLSIFPEAGAAKQALAALPRPQLIINNWVNPEILSKEDKLDFIADYADSFGVPVINHPRRAYLTTRQRNAERLAGIPNLLVPRILRILNDPQKRQLLISVISEELGFPVIIRSPFTQEGAQTVKIETPAELAAYLSSVKAPQLYAIQYIHNPVPEGAYRKIRAVVIGSELVMLHVRFGTKWNVHRAHDANERRNLMAFDTKGTAAAFALKILRRPEEALGKPAMAALHEIRARTPLDFFGIDFDLLPDGRLLFFETNAAMNFGMREKEDLPEIILAMRKAFCRLFENPPPPPSP
jgi:glutathione synthase/RimK-type ligase-like ATP-grasp enzyme